MSKFHQHEVKEGECISSIAYSYGFFPETLWNLPENADLKELRKYPNTLFPSDIVFVPEKRTQSKSAATDQRHKFQRKGVPEIFRLVLEDVRGEPRSQVSYRAEVDGKTCCESETESDGLIEVPILPNSQKVHIYIDPEERSDAGEQGDVEVEHLVFMLGNLDPIDETRGV